MSCMGDTLSYFILDLMNSLSLGGDWYYHITNHNFHIDSPEFAELHINHKEVFVLIVAALCWTSILLCILTSE